MRKRIKTWQDSGELDTEFGTWDPEVYAALPVLEDKELWRKYEFALKLFRQAKEQVVNHLQFNVPLNSEEIAFLEHEKAELDNLNKLELYSHEPHAQEPKDV